MKGIILAGDSGSRLEALTIALPKQLLPIYDKPMIYYPIETLVDAGITDILIITAPKYQKLFKNQLGDGSQFKARFSYLCQEKPHGIAEALTISKPFIDKSGVCLVTGDTIIICNNFRSYIEQADRAIKTSGSATIFVCDDSDKNQYGRIEKDKYGKNKAIVGTSYFNFNNSIIGLYVYPADSIKFAETIEPSERGLLEITTLHQIYLKKNRLQIIMLDKDSIWLDTNSADSLLASGCYIKNYKRHDS